MLADRMRMRGMVKVDDGPGESYNYIMNDTSQWEMGFFLSSGGNWRTNAAVRDMNYYPFEGNTFRVIPLGVPHGASLRIVFYDESKVKVGDVHVSQYAIMSNGPIPSGTKFMRWGVMETNFKEIPNIEWALQFEINIFVES